MIPQELIEVRGMSIISAMFYSIVIFALGYVFNEFRCYRRKQDKHNEVVSSRIYVNEKCIAVMKDRDKSLKEVIEELKEDVGKLFGKMEDVRVELASMNGNGLNKNNRR